MAFVDGKFVYQPEVDYKAISEKDSPQVATLLKEFRKGYLAPLQHHMTSADALRKYLHSSSISSEFSSLIAEKIGDVDRDLMHIVRVFSQGESSLEPHTLEGEAIKIYHSIFGDEDRNENKINYVKLIKIYEYLFRYNREILERWNNIKNFFLNITPDNNYISYLEQILEYKVFARIETCEMTDLLLRRIAYIVSIPYGVDDIRKLKGIKANFSTLLKYNIGTIFDLDLENIIYTESKVVEEKVEVQVEKNTCIADPYFLDSRGSATFNQSYIYTLTIDEGNVITDTHKIENAIYIETHLSAEEISLKQEMIRQMVSSSLRKDNMEKYKEFLNGQFDLAYNMVQLHNNKYNDREKTLLMYHIGPVFFLKIIMQYLREGRTGYIHRFLSRKTMARELPFEFIKFTMKDWWDINIYKNTNERDRNLKDIFDQYVVNFQTLWAGEQSVVLEKIADDPAVIKSYHLRDYKLLRPFLQKEISYLFYTLYSRFLGTDFLYLPFNKLPHALQAGAI